MKITYSPQFRITNSLIKKLTEASAKEARLQGYGLPSGNKLEISSLANIDAVHFSTKLEGNLLTYEQVTDILGGHVSRTHFERDLREVLNYSKTRSMLLKKAAEKNPLTSKLILESHKLLMANIVTGKLRGYYRQTQNVIKDAGSGKIVYLPPEAADVSGLMESLCRWVHQNLLDDLSPYIVAAVFHYYFVTIHPFLDGNGRSARLLSSFILMAQNITVFEYASLEKQHEQDRKTYYEQLRALQATTFYDIPPHIEITHWIDYFLDYLLKTYDEALLRCDGLTMNEGELHLDARLQKALGLFKKHGQLKAIDYQILMGLGRTQAVSDLNQLIDKGVIVKKGKGRSQVYCRGSVSIA